MFLFGIESRNTKYWNKCWLASSADGRWRGPKPYGAAYPPCPDEEFRFRIMGDSGIVDLNPYGQLNISRAGKMETVFEQPKVGHEEADSAFAMPRMQAYCDQIQGFVNSINGSPGGEGTAEDGRAGVEAVLAMLQSSRNQQTTTIKKDA